MNTTDLHDQAVRATAHFLRKASDWQEGQDYLSNHKLFGPWLDATFGDDALTEIQSIIRDAEEQLGDELPVLMATRVQIPAYTDRWMMGDRFGNVVRITRSKLRNPVGTRAGLLTSARRSEPYEIAHVLLDKSNKVVRVILADCEVVS